jgi:hypothetical protein
MTISNELLDELLKGCKRPEALLHAGEEPAEQRDSGGIREDPEA